MRLQPRSYRIALLITERAQEKTDDPKKAAECHRIADVMRREAEAEAQRLGPPFTEVRAKSSSHDKIYPRLVFGTFREYIGPICARFGGACYIIPELRGISR